VSFPESTHKTIEEAVVFVNSKIEKHSEVIQRHTDKLKYYHQIKETLDGEIRWRSINRARSTESNTKSSSKGASSSTRKKTLQVDPLLQPVKEEVGEEEPPAKKGRRYGTSTL